MNLNRNDVWLGGGVVLFGVFLLLYAIPTFVTSPSNVRNLVLSPAFWPTIIGWIVILLGVVLAVTRMFGPPLPPSEANAMLEVSGDEMLFAWGRLAIAGVLMAVLVIATPVLGMVLATGLTFAAFAILVTTPKPVTSLIVAIVLPLVLYAFFAHVAGVSVPQGRFLSLP